MNSKKILILFTSPSPFSLLGVHLENEAEYLFKAFDKVSVFVTLPYPKPQINVPSNVRIINVKIPINFFKKISTIKFLFSMKFVDEWKFVRRKLKQPFSFGILKVFLSELHKATILKKVVCHHLSKELQKNNSVYFYSYWNDYQGIAAALLKAQYPFAKAISRAHGWDLYFERHPWNYLPGENIIYKNLDAVFYVSANGYLYSKKIFGDLSNFKISHLGISNSCLPDYNKSRIPFHITSCSNIISLKRLDLIIRSLSLINDKFEIKWTHIGDGPLFENMRKLSAELLTPKTNISYNLTGFLSKEAIMDFLKKEKVNLFINVSNTEGLPVTIMEAMSCGIPVIATNVGGVAEIVEDAKNGTLLSANPVPQEVTDMIERFVEMSDEKYTSFCKEAYRTWFSNFNADKNYPDFIREIMSL